MDHQPSERSEYWLQHLESGSSYSYATCRLGCRNGSFLRVNNITIGYTLPKLLVNKLNIQNIRIYVTGYNLHCFTKYSGTDPEVDCCTSTPMTPGIDYAAYPKSRSFVGGINVTF